ncbi:hypothetical protein, partial [Micromonospora sp. 15K316]|uniref:hypothetical protein n=1 Tax=Micromonospora sp. 15K316 TaxID=2530376 RepID=UPI001404F22C
MIERGSGRTSSLTDWHRMDVNSMWACLQDHDTANHWKQVAGWRKICDLAQTHLSRLQEYRRGLAAAWPPASNAAALAYLTQLDELIDKVRRTHDAAAANYTALAAATQAIGGTRAKLQRIHEEYAAKLQQKRAYEATAADPKAAMGSRVPDRPVTDDDLEQLNVQARGIMYGLSSELQQAQATLQKPPVIKPRIDNGSDEYTPGAVQAPVIPTIIPAPASPSSSQQMHQPPPVVQMESSPKGSIAGPVLGSASAGLAHTPLPPPPSVGPTPSPAVSSNIDLPPSLPQGGQRGFTPGPQDRTGYLGRPTSEGALSRQTGTPRSTGGIIGGIPGGSIRQPGASNEMRHINPIGGVIGTGGAGTAPTGGAGSRPGSGRGYSTAHGMPIGG